MSKRIKTEIGDIFSAKIDGHHKKCFQYVCNDISQLNSDVIRVFKTNYPTVARLDVDQVVLGDEVFFVHCDLNLGLKLGYWEKEGHSAKIGSSFKHVIFRDTHDYADPTIEVSENLYIWKVGQEFKKVGKLRGENQNSEIGIVVNPDSIVHRMRTGEYDFLYPAF